MRRIGRSEETISVSDTPLFLGLGQSVHSSLLSDVSAGYRANAVFRYGGRAAVRLSGGDGLTTDLRSGTQTSYGVSFGKFVVRVSSRSVMEMAVANAEQRLGVINVGASERQMGLVQGGCTVLPSCMAVVDVWSVGDGCMPFA